MPIQFLGFCRIELGIGCMQFHTGEEGQRGMFGNKQKATGSSIFGNKQKATGSSMFGNKQKATGSSMFGNKKIASRVLFDCISS